MEWKIFDMQQQSPDHSKPYQKRPRRLSNNSTVGSPLFRSSSLVVPRPLKITQDMREKQQPLPEKTEFSREVCSILARPTSRPTSCPSPTPSPNQSPFFSHPPSPFETFSPPDRSHNPITMNSPFFGRGEIRGEVVVGEGEERGFGRGSGDDNIQFDME